MLQRHPLKTQAITTGLLWATGDYIAQRMEGKGIDRRRAALSVVYGASVIGPVGHHWYHGLDKAVSRCFLPGSLPFLAAKVAADTFVFTPAHVAAFFAFMTVAEGGRWKDVKQKFQQDFVPTFVAEAIIWPPYQYLNFARVPVQHQLLMCNAGAVLDGTFLSWARKQTGWMSYVVPRMQAIGVVAAEAASDSLPNGPPALPAAPSSL
ncbi:hypothetical protein WJX72_004536 [[Myrmecia] bisecta]|uniref:Uncharacterized protein n=1 Tax=[Myrmecia] bisecta TaxID=41462 RepID=A0AAW1PEX5_9CHLO